MCPQDFILPATTACRQAAGVCVLEGECDGVSVDCPAVNVSQVNGLACRGAQSHCGIL
jgi:hypothetical protein